MKKALKILLNIAVCVLFVAIWYIELVLFGILYADGTLSVIGDAFGQFVFYLWIVFGIIAFFSIILSFFVKRQWLVCVIAYSLTAAFTLSGLGLVKAGENKFSEFNRELWQKYPAQRDIMYYDLSENYKTEGLSEVEIKELLGETDRIYSEGTAYEYSTGYNEFVGVIFGKDGKVTEIILNDVF